MRLLPVILLVSALAWPATATTDTLTVSLIVHTDFEDANGLDPATYGALPGTASCTVTVPAGSNAADVLDQAAADGCISGWDCTEFGFDCFVTEVDGLTAQGLVCIAYPFACQWWEFFVGDGETSASTGVFGHAVDDGETLRFLFHTA